MRWLAEPADPERAVRESNPERGSAVLELPFVLGLIVVPFALLVLQLPIWVQHQAAAEDAAAEVTRLMAVHGHGNDNGADISQLTAAIESSRGLKPGTLHASVNASGRPGEPITVSVTVDIPTLTLPVFGVIGQATWTAAHTERQPDFGSVEK